MLDILSFIWRYYFNPYVLIAMAISLGCCLLRRKRFGLTIWQTLILYFVRSSAMSETAQRHVLSSEAGAVDVGTECRL